MFWLLFSFLVRPTATTEEILSFENGTKDGITVGLVILYLLASQLTSYCLLGPIYTISPIALAISSMVSFIGFYLYNICIQLFWKILGWQGSFRDIALVAAYSTFPFVLWSLVVFVVIKLLWLGVIAGFIFMGFWSLIPVGWTLVVYSKSLSAVQKYSETKVLVNVLVIGGIFYFLSTLILNT